MMRRVLVLAALLLAGCSSYQQSLVNLIERSDRIVVTEHSSDVDAYSMLGVQPGQHPPVIYATREVREAEKKMFRDSIAGLDPQLQDAWPACIFDGHHTIRYYKGDKLLSTMQVCFGCGQVEWDGSSKTPPWALYSGLGQFIESIGLHPKRDWDELARQHLKK